MRLKSGHWIVANTKVNSELFAVEQIAQQGFEAYCPAFEATVKHARKTLVRKKPLFPNYIFIRLVEFTTSWRPLMSTRGVRSLIMHGGKLSVLPENFVSDLIENEKCGELSRRMKPQFCEGEKVVITGGAFKDVAAQVNGLADKDRIWLLLDILGRKVRVSQQLSGITLA